MTQDYQASWDTQASASAYRIDSSPARSVASASSALQKQIVTIRLDVDTLNWFKSQGAGYQTRINQLLREHMQAQLALET
jgi:uncharacterized protein (DUF4415 family)